VETYLTNIAGRARRATRNGREYLIADMTLIVPGVLNGSRGPLYYPPDEIERSADSWNDIPIVVYHPTKNGQGISGRAPDVLDMSKIGRVYNAVVDRHTNKLKAEGWFDIERTRKVDPRVLSSIESGRPIEISTGLFTDNEPRPGVFNGKRGKRSYTYVARNYRPDHLAILPDQTGACSLADGCGVLVNTLNVSTLQDHEWFQPVTLDGEERYLIHNAAAPDKLPEEEECECGSECDKCKDKATHNAEDDARTLVQRFLHWLTSSSKLPDSVTGNVGKYGNPQSGNTGKFKPHGSGTGKGEVHERAQAGYLHLSDEDLELGRDAKRQKDELGENPPNWSVDEGLWEKAKKAADKGDYEQGTDTYWAVVTHIYKKMGGTIKGKSEKTDNAEGWVECERADNASGFASDDQREAFFGHFGEEYAKAKAEGGKG
jgi:hypothetical protein